MKTDALTTPATTQLDTNILDQVISNTEAKSKKAQGTPKEAAQASEISALKRELAKAKRRAAEQRQKESSSPVDHWVDRSWRRGTWVCVDRRYDETMCWSRSH